MRAEDALFKPIPAPQRLKRDSLGLRGSVSPRQRGPASTIVSLARSLLRRKRGVGRLNRLGSSPESCGHQGRCVKRIDNGKICLIPSFFDSVANKLPILLNQICSIPSHPPSLFYPNRHRAAVAA
jgi:hypothetical protein